METNQQIENKQKYPPEIVIHMNSYSGTKIATAVVNLLGCLSFMILCILFFVGIHVYSPRQDEISALMIFIVALIILTATIVVFSILPLVMPKNSGTFSNTALGMSAGNIALGFFVTMMIWDAACPNIRSLRVPSGILGFMGMGILFLSILLRIVIFSKESFLEKSIQAYQEPWNHLKEKDNPYVKQYLAWQQYNQYKEYQEHCQYLYMKQQNQMTDTAQNQPTPKDNQNNSID